MTILSRFPIKQTLIYVRNNTLVSRPRLGLLALATFCFIVLYKRSGVREVRER
jgi:hypothetical protein